jgi:hypothetical protein
MSRWERWAPLSGVAFVVLFVPGFALLSAGGPRLLARDPARYVAYYARHYDDIRGGAVLALLAGAALLWFVGTLAARLRNAEGPPGRLSTVAMGGGVAAATCLLVATVMRAAPASRMHTTGALTGGQATTLSDAAGAVFGIASPIAFAVLVGSASLVGVRHHALPRWLSWSGLALAVVLVVPFAGWIGLPLLMLWVLVTGVLLCRSSQPPDAVFA